MLLGVRFSLREVDTSLERFLRTPSLLLYPDLHEKVKCLAVDLEKAMAEADLEEEQFISARHEDWPAMRLYELETTSCRLKTALWFLLPELLKCVSSPPPMLHRPSIHLCNTMPV